MHARASAPGKLEPPPPPPGGVQPSQVGVGERRAHASKPALSSAALHKELLLVCVPVTSTARRRWSEETGTLLVARRLVWPLWPACACAGTWDDETKMT
jgi:hypothetical protein